MNCEICGEPIRGRPITAIVDRAKLMVCEKCGKHASGRWEVEKVTPLQSSTALSLPPPNVKLAFEQPKRKERVGEEFEVIEDFGPLIRRTREKLSLSYEELGRRINEKVSVIQRLESQKLIPDIKLAKKLEYSLKIKLLREAAIPAVSNEEPNASETTLGDIVTIKHRK
jgi:putative transcription factor